MKSFFVLLVFCSSVLAYGASSPWKAVKVLSGPGTVKGNLERIDPSWKQLKFKWGSPCPNPRVLVITVNAPGGGSELAREELGDLGAVGEYALWLPTGAGAISVLMTNGPCQSRAEVEIFAGRGLEETFPQTSKSDVPKRAAKKPKRPKERKPPTQPSFSKECVTVSEIYSHSLGIFSGVFAPEPGLDAKVHNSCNAAVYVNLTIAYLDGQNNQVGMGMEASTLAPGVDWRFSHTAALYGLERGRLRLAKIIDADVYVK